MKCKKCKNKYTIVIKDIDYSNNNQIYKIYNVPVAYCEACNEYILTDSTRTFIDSFIKRLANTYESNEYDFKKIKEDDDAAAAAAIIIM